MMKNLLLTVALSAMAVAGNAQSLVAKKTMSANVQNKVLMAAPQTRNCKSTKSVAPLKSPSTGVGFGRPTGTLYSEYGFSSDGVSYDVAALMVPSLVDVKYEHYCKGIPTWTWNGQELTNVDAGGNLTVELGAIDPESERNYSAYYAPVCSYGGEDFSLTEATMVANDYMPITCVNPLVVTQYTGFSEGPAFGTGSVLENALAAKDTVPFGTFQAFDKPVYPMSLQSIHATMWTTQKSPLAGKQLTAKLYRMPTEEGATIDLDNPVATFVCKTDPELTEFSSGGAYYGQMYFYNYVEDPITGEMQEAVNIDYEFAVLFEGYQQDGVDVRFFLCDQGEDINEFPFAKPTRIATRVPAESGEGTQVYYYYWGGTWEGTQFMYTMPFGLDVLYDVARVLETGQDTEGNVYTDLNLFHLSDDGQTCYQEGDDTKTATAGVVYSVFSWYDDASDAQYTFSGCPDWLTLTVADQGYSSDSNAYLTYVGATATALPEGTKGRTAVVYVTSDKGACSTYPLVFAQGTDKASGIDAVTVNSTLANGACYNIAGQKVSADFKGLTIQNGKKVLK